MRWLVVLLLAGCGATHLELAKRNHERAITAQRANAEPQARGAFMEAAAEAQRSIDAREEGAGEGQAWLILGSARLNLGALKEARAALDKARAAGVDPDRPWLYHALVAAYCAYAADQGRHHFAALCYDHLLRVTRPGDDRVRAYAAVGFANAQARRKPRYTALVDYADPLFQRLLDLTREQPIEGDLPVVLAKRLSFFCDDPAFTADLAGWRTFQQDLLAAAVDMDRFDSEDRRKAAAAALERARAPGLCPQVTP